MLTQDDFKQIGAEVGKVIEQNITPALDEMRGHIDELRGHTDELRGHIDELRGGLGEIKSAMVTKSYLDDKLADLEGVVIVRQRKEDQKVNLLISLLQKKAVLAESDVQQLREIQVFPAPPLS